MDQCTISTKINLLQLFETLIENIFEDAIVFNVSVCFLFIYSDYLTIDTVLKCCSKIGFTLQYLL